MREYKNLTIFFVSYYSKKNIKKILKNIPSKIKILIVDNANEVGIEKYFKNFKNVKIINSNYNSGQSGGINIGFKNIKTKYSLYMDPDVTFKKKIIDEFIFTAKKVKDFVILAPKHERSNYIREFISDKISKFKNLTLMKIVHGHFLFMDMKNVRKVGFFDENFFLYFEETDFCLRAYKKKLKIYVLERIKVKHEGGWSVDIENKLDIEANKHWHYMWSKFYFYKKNYSIYHAYKKTIFDLIECIFKFLLFYFFSPRKKIIYYNKISGLINSYCGKKSFKRLKI